MPQYSSGGTLDEMVQRVLNVKPNAQSSEVVNALNARIRTAINSRIYWADLLAPRIISFPAAYTTGTLALATGSVFATGTTTAFPISDVVNTTCATAIVDFGYQEVTPVSMSNIAVDTMLCCDTGGTTETVAVVEVTPVSFWAKFRSPHSAPFTITSSSLAGLQLDLGSGFPIFTVRAVRTATSLELDQPWGGAAVTGVGYQIFKMFTTIDPLLKVIVSVVDPQMSTTLSVYTTSIEQLDQIDPQRSSQQNPLALIPYTPSEAGSMRYEVYPGVTSTYQLRAIVGLQWPDLKLDTDRAPWFLDPNLFVTGACADILRMKNIKFDSQVDPFFNPQLAMEYEQMFRLQLQDAVNADEAKAQRAFSSESQSLMNPGGNFLVNHDLDVQAWRL